jgi:hypothetical protein
VGEVSLDRGGVEKGLRVHRILNKRIGNTPCACRGEVEQDGDMGSVSQLASEVHIIFVLSVFVDFVVSLMVIMMIGY